MAEYDFKDVAAFKGVWVFCEQRGGEIMPTDEELISRARILADELGEEVVGLTLGGKGIAEKAKVLGGYGADKIIAYESDLLDVYTTDAYTKVIVDSVKEFKPSILLIGATNIGRDLGPRIAARLHTGLCADCTHLDIDSANYQDFLREVSTLPEPRIAGTDFAMVLGKKHDVSRDLKMTRPAFGGHLMATIICPRFRPQMATCRPGVMKRQAFDQAKADAVIVETPAFELTEADLQTKVLSVEKAAKKLVDLIGADIIVSVGRGISKDVEGGIKLAEALAEELGGVVGSSRAVVDSGWISRLVRLSIPSCTSLWASPVLSSIWLVCRNPNASSLSTRTTPLPSLKLLTTASAATCSRLLPCCWTLSRLQRLTSNFVLKTA